MKIKSFTKGNSLIELIVYLAIFSVLCLVIIKSLVTSMTVYGQSQGYRKLQAQGELVMERITHELRQATSASITSSGVSPSTLTLTGKDTSGTSQTFKFDLSGANAVQITTNSTVVSPLTGGNIKASSLIFTTVSTSKGTAVKVNLTLTTTSGYSVSAPFQTTVFLRGK